MGMDVQPQYVPQPSALFRFEEQFDFEPEKKWMDEHYTTFLYLFPLYFVAVFGVQHLMRDRKRFEVRQVLILWNFSMGLFSVICCARMVPELVYTLREFGFHYTVCVPSFVEKNPVTAFWCYAFGWSKTIELVDTLFIVLRKRKLIFLHLYHHSMVYVYCVLAATSYPAFARWFVCVNAFIHGLMYPYYGLMAARFTVPKRFAMVLTTLQLLQMVFATVVSCLAYYYNYIGLDCNIPRRLGLVSAALAFSFGILFLNYFVKTYIKPNSKKIA